MALAHAVGMSNLHKRLLEKTVGQGLVERVLLTTAVAIGLVGAITSERTVLNAKTASMTSSAASPQCRPVVRSENSNSPSRGCTRQRGDERPSDR